MNTPLAAIEPRLRSLLPADLYARAWLDSRYADDATDDERRAAAQVLVAVADHLRTMQYVLYDYVPRDVVHRQPKPGQLHHRWIDGVLMFTDLSGFTGLMEANAERGRDGAAELHTTLNRYFAEMIHIISEAGGTLLQFTGDAVLVRFRGYQGRLDVGQAVRTGVRMQRAMTQFAAIDTPKGNRSLRMRLGIHVGRYLNAEIGTPLRMEHILLGEDASITKHAEGLGEIGRVNLTPAAHESVRDQFRFEPGREGHWLLIDDLTDSDLDTLELPSVQRRLPKLAQLDYEPDSIVRDIEWLVHHLEPLASYLPARFLNLLVENVASASDTNITPDFAEVTVMFVNLAGLNEASKRVQPGEEAGLVEAVSSLFARVNAAVEARGGVLKKVTYHPSGSDVMIFFGVPSGHTDDPARAAAAALAIRDVIAACPAVVCGGEALALGCQIGIATGMVFAAEIGARRSRREYNVLGDTVNTAARLMARADLNQIQLTGPVYQQLDDRFAFAPLGAISLKGKAEPVPLYELVGWAEATATTSDEDPDDDLPDIMRALFD